VNWADIQQEWSQDGTFVDSEGVRVRAYDDVELLEAATSEPDANGSVLLIPAGATGTVLFYSTGEPCLLQLEYDMPGMIHGAVEAHKTRLFQRNEEKYSRNASN
jgi:hypothetical protein